MVKRTELNLITEQLETLNTNLNALQLAHENKAQLVTDEHYERIKLAHKVDDIEYEKNQNKALIEELKTDVDKKVDSQHFIDEMDYFKLATSQVNDQFNDALSEASKGSNLNPKPIKRNDALEPPKSAGMNGKERA